MKTIHYLSGLPRSGNTVLSTILNQHPDIYCSPLSPINDLLWNVNSVVNFSQNYLRNPNNDAITEVSRGLLQSYYKNISKPIVIDREKCWTTPANLNLLKTRVNTTPKILFTVRDVLEILASYLKLAQDNLWIDASMAQEDFYPMYYLPVNEARCEFLMSPKQQISKALLALHTALNKENRSFVHFVDYNDLVKTPQSTMNKVYEFLEIESYNHDFNNLKKLELDNELNVNQPENLHHIRKVLKKESRPIEDMLSPRVIKKYSGENSWKEKLQ